MEGFYFSLLIEKLGVERISTNGTGKFQRIKGPETIRCSHG
jgi:hypothetical protein